MPHNTLGIKYIKRAPYEVRRRHLTEGYREVKEKTFTGHMSVKLFSPHGSATKTHV